MIAKIFIKRKFKQGNEQQIVSILNQMRGAVMSQPGYISGETLMNYEDPHTFAVISTWQNIEAWHKWKKSTERKQIESMLEVFQVGFTVYEEYLAGFTPKQ